VDEFQDSNPNQIELIGTLLDDEDVQSLTVIGDHMQSIYEFRNATPENLLNFAKRFPNVVEIGLGDNFRSQPGIVATANNILSSQEFSGTKLVAHKQSNMRPPAFRLFSDAQHETALFVRQIKDLIKRGHAPSSIAVLCRTKKELLDIEEALEDAGVPHS